MTDCINTQAIIEVARENGQLKNQQPQQIPVDGVPSLVAYNGTITPLKLPERFLNNPRRKRANVSLYETRSFIDYVNRHKVASRTHLFGKATELGGSFTAILDYHDEQNTPPASVKAADESASPLLVGGEAAPVLANWGEHVVTLSLETTPEWRRWIAYDKKLLPQETFLEFLEENQNDIIAPDQATVLETIQLLQGTKTVNFKGGKNLKNGAIALQYVETIEVRGQTSNQDQTSEVPDKLRLGIVPFIGANGIEIDARLRFRIGPDGKLSFAYVLNRPYQVIEDAFTVARDDIENGVGLKVLLGSGSITLAP
jgi:uncharacterized protein YfdQ (DUF2303 family)